MFASELRLPGAPHLHPHGHGASRPGDKVAENANGATPGRSDWIPPRPFSGVRRTLSGSDLGRVGGSGSGQPPSRALQYRDSLGGKAGDMFAAKGGARQWIRFDKTGDTSVLKADKHHLQQQLGVQLRDLRLLDPQLNASYPSAILCRDKALVCNLEHIKCIISTDYVLVLNASDEAVIAFVQELQRRLTPDPTKMGYNPSAPNLHGMGPTPFGGADGHKRSSSMVRDAFASQGHEPPFELRVLEVALDMVSAHLEQLATQLDAQSQMALDNLTKQVNTNNLERVRTCKSRLVRLVTRVETIREVLEKFLDDDSDMHAMHLTARALDQLERKTSFLQDRPTLSHRMSGGVGNLAPIPSTGEASSPHVQSVFSPLEYLEEEKERDEGEVAEVEMVLETYFMHIDNTYNKLQTLTEYIDDTEDYINIELDNHRNQLIRLELLITAATFAVALIGGVSGIFGMNLNNTHQDSYTIFIMVSVLSSIGALGVFFAIYMFCRWKKLV